jgi:hypothetical protein
MGVAELYASAKAYEPIEHAHTHAITRTNALKIINFIVKKICYVNNFYLIETLIYEVVSHFDFIIFLEGDSAF